MADSRCCAQTIAQVVDRFGGLATLVIDGGAHIVDLPTLSFSPPQEAKL
ncbi:hypothetical protein ABEH87_20155 [Erwinia sp. Eh17-17]